MFGRKSSGSDNQSTNRWLIVGLGNPGPEYEKTRHNIGAMVVNQMATTAGVKFSSHKARANVAEFKLGFGADAPALVVATLRCYMNDSGGPTKALADFYKIKGDHIIIAHDELDIAYQAIRVKFGGGDNGHNGLKSITSALGTAEYFRLRLGIGRPPGQQNPADFVLKSFSSTEKKSIDEFLITGGQAVESLVQYGLEKTQQNFNS
ncbi:MAG: aminoacyl-tRNA hydrolase [Candidatus Nanopelagicaceae bacterium]|nr:aminoacyl-tRNA hydrolase [Candidatus Nanopelagicaceae bacterium]